MQTAISDLDASKSALYWECLTSQQIGGIPNRVNSPQDTLECHRLILPPPSQLERQMLML